uniref:Uncharacterized protein n=1 Tax=Knipowitschia caucasica TaxID=637954 RepID=A0AAV2K617_KNICA
MMPGVHKVTRMRVSSPLVTARGSCLLRTRSEETHTVMVVFPCGPRLCWAVAKLTANSVCRAEQLQVPESESFLLPQVKEARRVRITKERNVKESAEVGSGDRIKPTAKSPTTSVPDLPSVPPHSSGRATKQSNPKKENQVAVTLQKSRKLPGNCLQSCGGAEAHGDAPLKLSRLLSVAHQDLFIRGKPTLQRSNRNMVESLSSLPSAQPLCLNPSKSPATASHSDCSINKIPKVEEKCKIEESSKPQTQRRRDQPTMS